MSVEPQTPSAAADLSRGPLAADLRRPAAAPQAGSSKTTPLLLGLLLATACLAVYRVTFGFELLTWDDDQHVTGNEYFQTITWRTFAHFWAYSYIFLYIPVSYNFFAVEVWIARLLPTGDPTQPLNPMVFHVGNVLVHLGCTLLAYRVLTKFTRSAPAAFFGALLFCLHPFQAESVSWVGETRGTLSTLFSLAALNLYLRYAGVDPIQGMFAAAAYEPPLRRRRDYWLAFLCFVLALLSKPSATSLPLVVLVIDVVLLRRRILTAVWRMLPWLVAAAVVTGLTKYYQRSDLMFIPSVAPLAHRPYIIGDVYAFYLRQLVWPFGTGFDHGRTPHYISELPGFHRAWLLPAVVVLIASLLPRRRIWLGCLAIFFVTILPVSGIVPFLYQQISTTADRYMYVPMFGFGLMAAAWIATRRHAPAAMAAAAVVLGLLVPRTIEQCLTWRDDWTLYRNGIEKNPLSYMANMNLGYRYRGEGQYEKAVRHFQRVVEIRHDYFWGHYHAGAAYLSLGRYDDALREFQLGQAKSPKSFELAVALGDAYCGKQDWTQAEHWYRAAADMAPDKAEPLCELAEYLIKRGRYAEAADEFAAAEKLDPPVKDLPRRYGKALLDAEQYRDAATWLEKRVAEEPDSDEARNDLASCYYSLSKFALAAEQAAAAVRLAPQSFAARHNYGLALAAVGKSAEARTQFEAALSLTPPGTTQAAEVRKALESLR